MSSAIELNAVVGAAACKTASSNKVSGIDGRVPRHRYSRPVELSSQEHHVKSNAVTHKCNRWAKQVGKVRGNITETRGIDYIRRGESMDARGSNIPFWIYQCGELSGDTVAKADKNNCNLNDPVMAIWIQASCFDIDYSETRHAILDISTAYRVSDAHAEQSQLSSRRR